ncbi:MAG: histidine--tRNA ligase [candidate division SR1 bacterium]|nr:histidine--tRNA ligase [candidate division SR1 bacterium]
MATKITSPKGFPEYLPKDQQRFDYLRNKIAETYASFGFYHIATPAVEYMKTLSSTGDVSKEIYAIKRVKGEGEEVNIDNERGLRFDLTKPLSRYTAEHYNDLTFPFKRYQIQPVWRGERPQKGRLREFYQADVDIIGNGDLSIGHDFEILQVIAATLDSLNIGKFNIKLNHRKLLQDILKKFGVANAHFSDALRIIDKVEKIGSRGVENLLVEDIFIKEQNAKHITDLLTNKVSTGDLFNIISAFNVKDKDPIDENFTMSMYTSFTQLYDFLHLANFKNINFRFDLSIARGLDYYTGMVFETEFVGYESYGSVASGGRYENLAGEFTNQKLPGVGGSIGLSRLFTLIQNEKIELPISEKKPTYYITYFIDEHAIKTRQISEQLRSQNNIVELAPEPIKLDKALKYAVNKDIDFLIIVEENGTFTKKNLKTREQENIENLDLLLK